LPKSAIAVFGRGGGIKGGGVLKQSSDDEIREAATWFETHSLTLALLTMRIEVLDPDLARRTRQVAPPPFHPQICHEFRPKTGGQRY
jgi:hypothetical protein